MTIIVVNCSFDFCFSSCLVAICGANLLNRNHANDCNHHVDWFNVQYAYRKTNNLISTRSELSKLSFMKLEIRGNKTQVVDLEHLSLWWITVLNLQWLNIWVKWIWSASYINSSIELEKEPGVNYFKKIYQWNKLGKTQWKPLISLLYFLI